jgi:hypothetical protein
MPPGGGGIVKCLDDAVQESPPEFDAS